MSSELVKALRERPGYLPAARMMAASAAMAEVLERPETSVARLRELEPALRISNLRDRIPYRRPEDLAKLADGLQGGAPGVTLATDHNLLERDRQAARHVSRIRESEKPGDLVQRRGRARGCLLRFMSPVAAIVNASRRG